MFDMGFTEMMLIGIVALIVIGPERLPGVARTAGKYFGRLKRFVTSVRADVEQELRADELRQILAEQQRELDTIKSSISEAGREIEKEVDAVEKVGHEISSDLQDAASESNASGAVSASDDSAASETAAPEPTAVTDAMNAAADDQAEPEADKAAAGQGRS